MKDLMISFFVPWKATHITTQYSQVLHNKGLHKEKTYTIFTYRLYSMLYITYTTQLKTGKFDKTVPCNIKNKVID